jgi:hypothetical protein
MCPEDTRKVLIKNMFLSGCLAEPEGVYTLTINRVPSVAVIARPEGNLSVFVMVRYRAQLWRCLVG